MPYVIRIPDPDPSALLYFRRDLGWQKNHKVVEDPNLATLYGRKSDAVQSANNNNLSEYEIVEVEIVVKS